MIYSESLFTLFIWYELMSFISYAPGIYNIDYDRVKELNNRLYAQWKEFRETCDKLHNFRTTVKDLTTNIKNLTFLKYLNKYEVAIQEAFDKLFATKTLIKREIIKYYLLC